MIAGNYNIDIMVKTSEDSETKNEKSIKFFIDQEKSLDYINGISFFMREDGGYDKFRPYNCTF